MTAPSNNDFRIAGALGIAEPQDPNQEFLTQGVGFPLRPISGTVPTNFPPLPEGVVAEGLPVQWMGQWQEGKYYPAGAEVIDGAYNCVCVVPFTLQKPAPVDNGSPSFSLPAYSPLEPSFNGFVRSGNSYTITENGWIKVLRVWLPDVGANISYQCIVVRTSPSGVVTTATFSNFVGVADNWAIIGALNSIVTAGTTIEIYLDALNSGSDTQFSGGWTNTGVSQSVGPPAQSWNRDNQFLIVRVDKTDLDGTDRSTELNGVIPNSTIQIVDTLNSNNFEIYRVNSVSDLGTYVQYGVTLTDAEGTIGTGSTTTMTFTVPVPTPTLYSEEVGVWPGGNPSWGTVTGYLELNGAVQSVDNNAYGVDIEFQPATVSTDWDIKGIIDL